MTVAGILSDALGVSVVVLFVMSRSGIAEERPTRTGSKRSSRGPRTSTIGPIFFTILRTMPSQMIAGWLNLAVCAGFLLPAGPGVTTKRPASAPWFPPAAGCSTSSTMRRCFRCASRVNGRSWPATRSTGRSCGSAPSLPGSASTGSFARAPARRYSVDSASKGPRWSWAEVNLANPGQNETRTGPNGLSSYPP